MSLIGTRYRTRACPECRELNVHGAACDDPRCPNYCGPLVEVVTQIVYAANESTNERDTDE